MTRKTIIILLLAMGAGATIVWAAAFDHRAHLEEYAPDAACKSCHLPEAVSIVPETTVCLECHEEELVEGLTLPQPKTHGPVWALNHRSEAKGSAIDCSACHDEQSFCLDCHKAGFADEQGSFGNSMINVHRSDFHVTHPIAARSDPNRCSACHEPKFCSSCHNTFRLRTSDIGSPSHRRSFDKGIDNADIETIHAGIRNTMACDVCHLEGTVAPDFHSWSVGHAREARKNLKSCQACHPEGDVCLRCHSARSGVYGFNPHPKDWDSIKGTLQKVSSGRTCRKCH